jgi:hypothetical protein
LVYQARIEPNKAISPVAQSEMRHLVAVIQAFGLSIALKETLEINAVPGLGLWE